MQRVSVSRVSEATLESFLVGFWPFPVLHCPCVSLCGSRFCGVCLVVGASKLQDQEQQLDQEQKGALKCQRHVLPAAAAANFVQRVSVSRVSEATLESFLVGFWPFPVLHCPCVSLCGSRFCGVCLVVGASKLQDQEQQLDQEQKGAKK